MDRSAGEDVPQGETWRIGLESLRRRTATLSDVIRRFVAAPAPAAPPGLASVRRVVTTGVGSSEAHARLVAHLLDAPSSPPARFRPLSALVTPPAGAADDALVLFSQGLSPNARLVLRTAPAWRRVVVATAADPDKEDEKGRILRALAEQGAWVVRFSGEDEYETLLRVVGPMVGTLAALTVARGFEANVSIPAPADVERLTGRIDRAADTLDACLAEAGLTIAEAAAPPITFLAAGDYGSLACNLQYKILEGLFLPLPPLVDLLHFAHGPFQEAFDREAVFVALTSAGARFEPLLEPLRSMLVAGRHRLLVFESALDPPLSLLEHEAILDELVLRLIAERRVDQVSWPGRGRDAPLYALDRLEDVAPGEKGTFLFSRDGSDRDLEGTVLEKRGMSPFPRRLELLTWPETERLVASGCRAAVLPLGATEQHGPHLPLAVDSWIAEELAARFCERLPETVELPVLRIGCSSEHLAFPGTLDLAPSTLEAVLADVLRSLARHGFEAAFLFSAHGGNFSPLAEALPRLQASLAPFEVLAFTDLAGLTELFHAASAREGISPEASGHHAGELETSILLALRPDAVRRPLLEAGLVAPLDDSQAIFYPSLRDHAPNGTVGDPRGADARRAERYLDAWVERLVESYRREKKRP